MEKLRKHRGVVLVSLLVMVVATAITVPILLWLFVPEQNQRAIAGVTFSALGPAVWLTYLSNFFQRAAPP